MKPAWTPTAGLLFGCALWAGACASASGDGNGSGLTGAGGSAGSAGAGASGGSAGFLPGDSGGDGPHIGLDGNTSPEVCDGVDNDGNAIIDDVDVGHDGVCDCLSIATLGVKGLAGQGNVFSAWLDSRSNNGAVDLADQVLTPALLLPFKVVVAQDVSTGHVYSPAEVTALHDWIQAGGGLLTLIGYAGPTEVVNVNTLLASVGMSYGNQGILFGGGVTLPVTQWQPHPVTNGVTRIGIDNGYAVQGAGLTIAGEQGFEVLKAQEVGKGHVLIWGDEWITYDSEWTAHPDYQVEHFWQNILSWLSPQGDCQVPIPTPR